MSNERKNKWINESMEKGEALVKRVKQLLKLDDDTGEEIDNHNYNSKNLVPRIYESNFLDIN